MGRGSSKIGGGGSFQAQVDALQAPSGTMIFPDDRLTPLPYDGSRMMEVVFGDWQKPENFVGVQSVSVDDIVATQPHVQANKLLRLGANPIDTSNVALLQIGNKYYLGDGNHRVVSAILQGKRSLNVRVYRR